MASRRFRWVQSRAITQLSQISIRPKPERNLSKMEVAMADTCNNSPPSRTFSFSLLCGASSMRRFQAEFLVFYVSLDLFLQNMVVSLLLMFSISYLAELTTSTPGAFENVFLHLRFDNGRCFGWQSSLGRTKEKWKKWTTERKEKKSSNGAYDEFHSWRIFLFIGCGSLNFLFLFLEIFFKNFFLGECKKMNFYIFFLENYANESCLWHKTVIS